MSARVGVPPPAPIPLPGLEGRGVGETERSAVLSDDGQYRYALRRTWRAGARIVLFVMLNPSTANALEDDNTIRKCIGYAKRWRYQAPAWTSPESRGGARPMGDPFGGIAVANLYAWRSRWPNDLKTAPDPVGPDNDRHVAELADEADLVVVAWGAWTGPVDHRAANVLELLAAHTGRRPGPRARPYCLGATKHGQPRHPLYLANDTWPVVYRPAPRSHNGPEGPSS